MYNQKPNPEIVAQDLEVFLALPAVKAAGIREKVPEIMESYDTDGMLSFGGGAVTLSLEPIQQTTIFGRSREMLQWHLTEFVLCRNGHWEPDDFDEIDGGSFRDTKEALLAVLSRFVGWELDSAWEATLAEKNDRLTMEHSSLMMRHATLCYELGPQNRDTLYIEKRMHEKEAELWPVRQQLKKEGK